MIAIWNKPYEKMSYLKQKLASHSGNMNNFFSLLILLFVLSACKSEEQPKPVALLQCINCHTIHTDANHQLPCISCHKGNNQANSKDNAHKDLVASPAHPDHLTASCGPCHAEIVADIGNSLHFTLKTSTNEFRKAFGAKDELSTFLETPQDNNPANILGLADDLLRRSCFRCHLYSPGDDYPSVSHGTGCAACHMAFSEGEAKSHSFQRPGDEQCLSCHYCNYVGFDYYGRFEHDFNYEYRTPFTTKNKHFRPYGVEYHQLKPDVHQLRGMLCIDCHSGRELMTDGGAKPSCKGCHSRELLQHTLPVLVENHEGVFILHGRDGLDHTIPLMQNPAHEEQTEDITCQACHAQWTYNDFGKHFLRSDTDNFDLWINLSVQGNFEIETIIDNNNDFDETELPAEMTDKLTGEPEVGLWHKGFTIRRWETIILGRDDQGRITTMRPALDYSLSWIDAEKNVRFDSVSSLAPNGGLRPYVPHTTGPAGIFYKDRIEEFLAKERSATTNSLTPKEINATQ